MGERKSRVLNEILSRWLKLWNRWRRKKLAAKAGVSGRLLKSGPLRRYFQHSGAKIRVLNRTQTSLKKFWLFYSVTAHEYSI